MIGYLSGPITGHPNYRQEFGDAADELRALGYNVINPAAIDDAIPVECMSYEAIMRIDLELLATADYLELLATADYLELLATADYLVQLPGWENSKGANRELGFALGADKIVVTYEALIGGRCHDIERDL